MGFTGPELKFCNAYSIVKLTVTQTKKLLKNIDDHMTMWTNDIVFILLNITLNFSAYY